MHIWYECYKRIHKQSLAKYENLTNLYLNELYIDKKRHTIKKEVYWQQPKSDTLVVFGSFAFSTFWLSFTQIPTFS